MKLHIVLCTDSNYVMPARVAISSVCVSNQGTEVLFHIVTDEQSKSEVEILRQETEKWKQRICFYVVDSGKCSSLPYGRFGQPTHASMASYYRLFLASLLPSDVDKLLYIDCDMIVRHPLDSLWQTDMNGYAIAGVDDMSNMDADKYNTLKYYPAEGYFNAGMLLINLKYWRENYLENEFLDFARTYPERIVFHDQDILNYVLRDRKLRLPFTYNVQDGFLYDTIHFIMWPFEDEFNEAITDPCIVHYSIRFKPWHKDCLHPWRDEYLKYVKLAGLDIDSFPQRKEHLNLYQRLRPLLVKFGFLSPLLSFSSKIKSLS